MKSGMSFFQYVYCLDKSVVILLMALMFFGCVVIEELLLCDRPVKPKKAFFAFYAAMGLTFLVNLIGVLVGVIFTRSTGEYEINTELFGALIARPDYEENWRTLLMNVFLFFPMGLAAPVLLPHRWNVWLRIILGVLFGFILSFACEAAQYAFGLGIAEVDDLFCNTLGMLLGTLHAPLGEHFARRTPLHRFWTWLHTIGDGSQT